MSEGPKPIEVESIQLQHIARELRQTGPFADTDIDNLAGVDRVDLITARAGAVLVQPGEELSYWLVLDGEARADRPEVDGTVCTVGFARAGDGFGETPLLTGKTESVFAITAVRDSKFVRFTQDNFWSLMACCPAVRKVALANMAQRLQTYTAEAVHREKLISLGTLAAGLMHELNNPGAAAKRAASQLRENLKRLQELSLRLTAKQKTQLQLDCMQMLLEQAMRSCQLPALSSLEQADAEEKMSEWLQSAAVENAYSVGPALVEIGFTREQLECARAAFENGGFSDALNWLAALVSSVSLVCSIEEAISRVSELVMAVKKFAYDDKSTAREVNVHDSLQSTLTLLGHKLRIKQVSVEKRFEASPAAIVTRGSALSQVWTNLIDNAIDASPPNSQIEVSTWTEAPAAGSNNGAGSIAVSIADHGSGIAPEVRPHIFEPFFTTKPQGHGTGLGLEIVHRIVTQKFSGTIEVESQPGDTKFIVRLPMNTPLAPATKNGEAGRP
ncbi:MAG TPA: ATP-binding protein [Terracidiphilus sp.]|nr:ATP-binding protein [Terracidiphilus sp.]